MLDEELREEFAAMLAPIRDAAPPGMPNIKRRMRHRRARNAAVGTAAIAAVAATGLTVSMTAFSNGAPVGDTETLAGSHGSPGQAFTSASPVPFPSDIGVQGQNVNIAGINIPGLAGEHRKALTYTVRNPVNSLVFNADASSIAITGSKRSTVSVTEYIQYLTAPPVAHRALSGKQLKLGYTCPADAIECGISYVVAVPRDIAVRIGMDSGITRLSDLSGPLSATIDSGTIIGTALTSSTVTFKLDSGTISAGFKTPPTRVLATTDTGAIALGLPGTVTYHVTTQNSIGGVSVSVPVSNSSPHKITANDDTGGITIKTGAA